MAIVTRYQVSETSCIETRVCVNLVTSDDVESLIKVADETSTSLNQIPWASNEALKILEQWSDATSFSRVGKRFSAH